MEKHKDIGASALGALAGGIIGSEMGHGSRLGTLVGAAIGGLGANVAEKKHEEGRKRREGEKYKRREKEHYKALGYDSY